MSKLSLYLLVICFVALFFTVRATEATTETPETTEEPSGTLPPIFQAPETIKITPIVFTLSVPQSNVEGMKLWKIFFELLNESVECAGFPRYISSPANLYNTEHRLYIDQLSGDCTNDVIERIQIAANEKYQLVKDIPEVPEVPETTTPETTTPFKVLGRYLQSKDTEPAVVVPAILSFKREAAFDLSPELCFNDQTDELFCLEKSPKCTIKCPVGTICSKDIVCGSSDCLASPDYVDEDGEKYRVCTSGAEAMTIFMAIAMVAVAVVM